jgi:ribose 5-phosphate isomerase RpiB
VRSGIVLGGSGNGEAIAANKVRGALRPLLERGNRPTFADA